MIKLCKILLDKPITVQYDDNTIDSICSSEINFLIAKAIFSPEGVSIIIGPGMCFEPILINDMSMEEFYKMKPEDLSNRVKSILGPDIKKSLQALIR